MSQDPAIDTAVVLAGGLGTRVKASLGDTPKLLADVAGKTLLERKCEELTRNGIRNLHLLLGCGSEVILAFLSAWTPPDLSVTVSLDGDTPQGTGGALMAELSQLPETFFLTYGDTLLDASYAPLEKARRSGSESSWMLVSRDRSLSTSFNTLIHDNRVMGYSKTRALEMNAIDYGLLLLDRESTIDVARTLAPPVDLSEIIDGLITSRNLGSVVTSARFWEVGTPGSLEATRIHFSGA